MSAPKAKITRPMRGIQFVKEWAGIAALLIGAIYTFPLDVFDRVAKWRDSDVTTARQVLADLATITIEAARTQAQLSNGPDLSGAFKSKYWNVLYPNRDVVANAVPKLKSNEVAQIALHFINIGQLPQGIHYYDVAIEKANEEGVLPIFLIREKAQQLYANTAARDPLKAREAFVEAIKRLAALRPTDVGTHALWLLELALHEKQAGDWQCGESLDAKIDPIIRTLVAYYPNNIRPRYQQLRSTMTLQKVGQPELGCPDLLNLMPELPQFKARAAAQPLPDPTLLPALQQQQQQLPSHNSVNEKLAASALGPDSGDQEPWRPRGDQHPR